MCNGNPICGDGQYRNPKDAELRVDFLTSRTRGNKPVIVPALNVALEPLKFMRFRSKAPRKPASSVAPALAR